MSGSEGKFDYDVAIIGAGSGGFAAARISTGSGLKAVLVEGGKEVGGLCILRGCMPTKALLYAGEILHLAHHSNLWGIKAEDVSFNWSHVMARKDKLIQEFADCRRQQLANGKFTFVRAMAGFTDPNTLELSSGQKLTAAHFVIATGSELAPYPLPQLEALDCLDSDRAMRLERLPRSMIVLGGGAVAVEFAQLFLRFGVKVTLIQRSPHILTGVDSDAAEEVEKALRREGMALYTSTKLTDARRVGDGKEICFEQGGQTVRVRAEEVFYALGRVPNLKPLHLERTGVVVEKGRIATSPRMQTSAHHIYAAGDCTGLYEIVHIAIQQGETAARNIINPSKNQQMDYRLLTEVVFTDPQVATVGLNEKRAQAQKIPYITAKYPFNDHGKSIIMGTNEGFVKLLADPRSGEILGGCCVGPQGGELIHEVIAAMAGHLTVADLAAMPHYHPTLAEIWTYPAEELAEQVSAKPVD
jgi:pyruvate/2-oxoglutarate dehydrogenase complex dihydrolipoamide dehydrogenase (E3) component